MSGKQACCIVHKSALGDDHLIAGLGMESNASRRSGLAAPRTH